MKKRDDIRIRAPFISVDREAGCYYMYGTSDFEAPDSGKSERRFTVYKSYDLESFDDGKVIFDGEKTGFWATCDYWAPEMHKAPNGKWYIYTSSSKWNIQYSYKQFKKIFH